MSWECRVTLVFVDHGIVNCPFIEDLVTVGAVCVKI